MIRQGRWFQFHSVEIKSKRIWYVLRNAKAKVTVDALDAGLGCWIDENCIADVYTCDTDHWFMNTDDAILFKLVWV